MITSHPNEEAAPKPQRTITTLKGTPIPVTDWFINGNGVFVLHATTPRCGRVTALEVSPGVFRDFDGRPLFKVAPEALNDLRADAHAFVERRRSQAAAREQERQAALEEEERLIGRHLKWGSGHNFGRTEISGVEISDSFIQSEIRKRGIAIATDWDAAFTKSARVPLAAVAEIVAEWKKRDQRDQATSAMDKATELSCQLWEPCQSCGSEPSYMTANGHLCARCAKTSHPRICADANTLPEGAL
jgi:hypothetical protein